MCSRRENTSSEPQGGRWELEDVVVNTTATTVPLRCRTLSGKVEKRRIFAIKKGWLWNLGGDVRIGCNGQRFSQLPGSFIL